MGGNRGFWSFFFSKSLEYSEKGQHIYQFVFVVLFLRKSPYKFMRVNQVSLLLPLLPICLRFWWCLAKNSLHCSGGINGYLNDLFVDGKNIKILSILSQSAMQLRYVNVVIWKNRDFLFWAIFEYLANKSKLIANKHQSRTYMSLLFAEKKYWILLHA